MKPEGVNAPLELTDEQIREWFCTNVADSFMASVQKMKTATDRRDWIFARAALTAWAESSIRS